MQITRQADYAIRCILYLSENPDKISIVDEIAEEMSVPKEFLAKVLQKLKRRGIVESFKGINGGFKLAKMPKEINLYDVIEAIDGPVIFNKCAVNKDICRLTSSCSVHPLWFELRKKVEALLRAYDFENLTQNRKNLDAI